MSRGVADGGLIKIWTFYQVDALYKDDKNALGRGVFFIASRLYAMDGFWALRGRSGIRHPTMEHRLAVITIST